MTDGPLVAETLPLRPRAAGTLLRCDCDLVGVLVTSRGRRLVAIRPIAEGTRIFTLTGRETQVPTRFSVQVGPSLHLDQECARDENDLVRRYFWRYMDHACEPATAIREREVIALRDLARGDGVTFDYNTTEYDMAEPFRCHCGSARCVGLVRGALHLSPAERARLAPQLPAYLRRAAQARRAQADAAGGKRAKARRRSA